MHLKENVATVLVIFCCGLGLTQTICKNNDKDTCKCDLVNGSGVIDITFGNTNRTALYHRPNPHGGPYVYEYNPCYEFTSIEGSVSGLATIMYSEYLHNYYDLGKQKNSTWKLDKNGSLVVFYTSNQYVSILTSTVKIVCDPQARINNITALGFDSTIANHNFILSGPALCPRKEYGVMGVGYFSIVGAIVLLSIYMVARLSRNNANADESSNDFATDGNSWFSSL
ncbi:uncharacterized protein LOC120336469 [Styela clava]